MFCVLEALQDAHVLQCLLIVAHPSKEADLPNALHGLQLILASQGHHRTR